MQTLRVVARLFPLIRRGEKRSTIRWQETRIEPAPMIYVCDGDESETVVVNVTRCNDMKLKEAARFLGRESEWPFEVMLEGMREHYPTITMEDWVQVIEHEPPVGSLV